MLNMQELAFLTDQEKQDYMEWERGFESVFWKKLHEMAENGSSEALMRAAHADTWDTNRISYGQRTVWELLANLEESVEREFQQAAAARAELQAQKDEVDYE